jgi:exosortase A-associated hydrolase 1
MRTGLSFSCEGEQLCATLDAAPGDQGLLIVTGGRQTRIGPHGMMAKLASRIAADGVPVFRFDRRGVGDSGGVDPGFRGSRPDVMAAVASFRSHCPTVKRIWGLGLCDGASALALHGEQASLHGLILLNPWVIEAEADAPPPEAIRAYYRDRLTSIAGWRHLLTHGFNPAAAVRGARSALRSSDPGLAHDVMTSLAAFSGPSHILLAQSDATARAFLSVYDGTLGTAIRQAGNVTLATRDSASHSFASPADHHWMSAQIIAALRAG